jgi:hypothetical protein
VIRGVAFCPHPPALVPELAQAAAPELDALRVACRAAIRRVAQPDAEFLVVGAGESTRRHAPTARGSFAGFGVDLEVNLGRDEPRGEVDLPLALTVGAWLLRDALGPGHAAHAMSVGPEGQAATPMGRPVTLLVMGDGSARRSIKAPGYLDDRAGAFDRTVAAILAEGDPVALTGIDQPLADELLVAGAPAWRAAGAMLLDAHPGAEWDAELLYDDAPYGVGYLAAAWTLRG